MLVSKENILTLIPQRPPFVMIDEFSSSSALSTRTKFHVTAENIFADEGMLAEAGLVENIAQTAAARAGYDTLQREYARDGGLHRCNKRFTDI